MAKAPPSDGAVGAFKVGKSWLHLLAAPYFLTVFVWHFVSPLAQRLPGYFEFGWFYRFLTFWTYTLQTFYLTVAAATDLAPKYFSAKWRRGLSCVACLTLCAATTVTVMYYGIRTLDPDGMDPPQTRVPWVNTSVHLLNSVVAWTDVLFCLAVPFDRQDRALVVLYSVVYSTWLLFIKFFTGSFPYPFLNKMPPLLGWAATCAVGTGFMLTFFYLARGIKRLCVAPRVAS